MQQVEHRSTLATGSSTLRHAAWSLIALADRLPGWLLGLLIRCGIAGVFWRSGQTKVSGWQITETTIQLFRDEYKVPLLSPEVAATLAAVQEHLFSFLLVIGLASRLSALGNCSPPSKNGF